MSPGSSITSADFGFEPVVASDSVSTMPTVTTLKEARSMVEKQLVEAALSRSGGNIVKAAETLGISRPTFYDLLRKHGIEQ